MSASKYGIHSIPSIGYRRIKWLYGLSCAYLSKFGGITHANVQPTSP
jgi:hypothetical protein